MPNGSSGRAGQIGPPEGRGAAILFSTLSAHCLPHIVFRFCTLSIPTEKTKCGRQSAEDNVSNKLSPAEGFRGILALVFVLRRRLVLLKTSAAIATPKLALLLLAVAVWCGCGFGCKQRAAPEHSTIAKLHLYDLSEHPLNPFADTKAKTLVFVFVAVDCPISNRYAPELKRLHARFAADGVQFWLVYPDARTSAEDAKHHLADYEYNFGGLRDPKHALVTLSGATITPEAAVFTREGHLLYCGRIDDRYPALGTSLVAPTQHDLADALAAIVNGKPVAHPFKPGVGCSIGDPP